jgi:hypothetical protein
MKECIVKSSVEWNTQKCIKVNEGSRVEVYHMGIYSYAPYPDIHSYAMIVGKFPVEDIEKEDIAMQWTELFSSDKICPHVYVQSIIEIDEGIYYRYMITDLYHMDYEFYLRYEIANPGVELIEEKYLEYQIVYLIAKLIWKYNLYLIDFNPKNILLLYSQKYIKLCDFEYDYMKYFPNGIDDSMKTSLLVIQLYFLKMYYTDLSKRIHSQIMKQENELPNIASIELLKNVNTNKHIHELEQHMKSLLYGDTSVVLTMIMQKMNIQIEVCTPLNLYQTLSYMLSYNDYFYLKWLSLHFPYMYHKYKKFESIEEEEEKKEYFKLIIESITFHMYLMN